MNTPLPTPVKPSLPKASRLGVVSMVYHQGHGEQPTSVESRWSRWLASDEQPYSRKLKIGEDWQVLDLGWIKRPSYIVLSNEEGKDLSVQPSQAEREILAARVVEIRIGTSGGVWLVRPGGSFQGEPVPGEILWVRCVFEAARCILTAFPE